jgi:hypothetical protein
MNNDVVVLNLDRPRVLRFGHKALKKLVASTGMELENLEVDGNNFEQIEKMIFFGLESDAKEHNETLKLEDMEDLLDKAPVWSEIIEKMELALQAAFGQMAIDEKNLQRVAENSKLTKPQK